MMGWLKPPAKMYGPIKLHNIEGGLHYGIQNYQVYVDNGISESGFISQVQTACEKIPLKATPNSSLGTSLFAAGL